MSRRLRAFVVLATGTPRVIVLGLGVSGLIALSAGPANASHVSCGDVITKNTKLDSDLACPVISVGLTIGADNVTLDLGGHRISGFEPGVVNEGFDGVTIKNGAIDTIQQPILLRDADRNRIDRIEGGQAPFGGGVLLDGSDENRVSRSRLCGNGGGVALFNGSDHNVITRNHVCGGEEGSPISIYDSDDNVITRNFDFRTGYFSGALLVAAGSDNTAIVRNRLDGGSTHGISVEASTEDTLVARNEVRDFRFRDGSPGFGGDGIHVESPDTTITRNSSNDNAGWGIFAVLGVIDGGHNTASGNGAGQCLNVIC